MSREAVLFVAVLLPVLRRAIRTVDAVVDVVRPPLRQGEEGDR